ncbi:MAG: hypothetical protein ACOC1F_05360 [Myxococcota bacterium]
MNFLFHASLFAGPTPIQLAALTFTAVLGRHRIEVLPDARPGFEAWTDRLGSFRDALLEAERASAHENAHHPSDVEISVEKREQSSWSKRRLTVDDAVELAHKPFRVLLENGVSDRRFLLAMLRPEDREWLEKRVGLEWVELEGCGGIQELKKRVRWALDAQHVLRCAALFDGDAVEPPAAQPESEADFRARLGPRSRRVLELCEREPVDRAVGLLHHVLQRRAIENYLPDRALESWVKVKSGAERRDRERKRKALRGCAHRFHYNTKDGYAGDRKRIPKPSWLPAAQNHPLEQGFGADISSFFADVDPDDFDTSARNELERFTTELLRRIR